MIASGPLNFIRIVCWKFCNFTFKTSYDIFYFFLSIKAHVRYRAFATLQIELYCIVHYDSKCSTKFLKDYKFEIFVISLLRRLMNILNKIKNVLEPMFVTELLQHSKWNCTV